ncbi:hypothetical protein OAD22_08790 [Pseudomonadales bacterium]|nr:hypothetical protein [Pseudomonadales bacterium]MDA9316222.1 hypothetical protein [Pseudomonadales bacterium]MDB4151075.1 hypothetical protein [Pseudomonadales bacterium]MDB9868547.1 hypothetical protein [Pseudomonadales bacterium]MDB9879443.1 hypothetical protein [Pseudomonadales bacterium]
MNLTKIAAGLMLFSGVSHPTQLLIYGTADPALVNSSLMGMSFLVVGALLLTGKRWALWIGAIQPLVFGIFQALNDLLIFSLQAMAALGSGYILLSYGWRALLYVCVPLLLAMVVILWHTRDQSAVAITPTAV